MFSDCMSHRYKSHTRTYTENTCLNPKLVGFFELQTVLNKYRELCGSEGMHRGLIDKAGFITDLRICIL